MALPNSPSPTSVMPVARWRSTTSATACAVSVSNSGVDCSVKPSSAKVRAALASSSAAVRGRLPAVVVATDMGTS